MGTYPTNGYLYPASGYQFAILLPIIRQLGTFVCCPIAIYNIYICYIRLRIIVRVGARARARARERARAGQGIPDVRITYRMSKIYFGPRYRYRTTDVDIRHIINGASQ